MRGRNGICTLTILVVAAGLLLPGCGLVRPCLDKCRGLPKPDCSQFPPGEITGPDRLGAMLSVHAHAYFTGTDHEGRPQTLHPDLRVMSLPDAAKILRCDEHPLASSRLRRATAKLAAYGWRDRRFDTTLGTLGLNTKKFRRKAKPQLAGLPEDIFALSPEILEYIFAVSLWTNPGLLATATAGACDAKPEKPFGPPLVVYSGNIITVDTYVSVALTRDEVAKNIDPQRWDECSEFWPTPPDETTYLASVPTPRPTPCRVTLADVAEEPALPAGVPYPPPNPRVLFERFECSARGCNNWFENVLFVNTQKGKFDVLPGKPPVDSFRVTYGLPKCHAKLEPYDGFIDGEIDNDPAEVLVDHGRLDAWEKGGRTHVRAHKSVAFSSTFSNVATAQALGLVINELNQQLGELACCLD